VHGIPSTRPLGFGDKINIDITAFIDGYHGDNNLTVFYGKPEHEIQEKVAEVTQQALYEAIGICRPGAYLNEIGRTIERVAGKNGMHVCAEFTGHGVGHLLHMPPAIFHCCKA
jgi:methionyl aminopeptidase